MRFLPFILLIAGVVGIVNFISAGNRSSKIDKLIKEGVSTMAVLNDEYSVTSKKSETFYETKYTFEVDGKTYEGTRKTYTEPSEAIVEIKYLAEDPSVNGYDLENEKSELKSHSGSYRDLFLGIGAALVGLIWLFFRFAGGSKKDEAAA